MRRRRSASTSSASRPFTRSAASTVLHGCDGGRTWSVSVGAMTGSLWSALASRGHVPRPSPPARTRGVPPRGAARRLRRRRRRRRRSVRGHHDGAADGLTSNDPTVLCEQALSTGLVDARVRREGALPAGRARRVGVTRGGRDRRTSRRSGRRRSRDGLRRAARRRPGRRARRAERRAAGRCLAP